MVTGERLLEKMNSKMQDVYLENIGFLVDSV